MYETARGDTANSTHIIYIDVIITNFNNDIQLHNYYVESMKVIFIEVKVTYTRTIKCQLPETQSQV